MDHIRTPRRVASVALDTPMSLFASVVFEQSYSGVEGDSACSAELYTLIGFGGKAFAPGLAVAGSVNQHGEIPDRRRQ